jgi:long-chain acyl-CoA synthetase
MDAGTIFRLFSSSLVEDGQSAVVEFRSETVRTLTRVELFLRTRRLSAELKEMGLQRGGRVVVFAPNSTDWIILALGVMYTGGVIVPLDAQMPGEDLAHALIDCDPVFIFTSPALQDRIKVLDIKIKAQVHLLDGHANRDGGLVSLSNPESAEPNAGADDLATIFYTSGTTGPPKGVPLTHRNLVSNVKALCEQGLADQTDRILVPLPFHHVYPFTVGILIPLTLGATILMPFSLVGPQIVRALKEGEATVMLGVPRLFEEIWNALNKRVEDRGRLVDLVFHGLLLLSIAVRKYTHRQIGRCLFASLHRQIGSSLRLMVSGGAALDPALGRKLQGLGWELATGYGLTETSPILTFNHPDWIRFESAGMVLPGVEIAIDASAGPGEVLARGPNVFAGYWNLQEKSAEVLSDDGWFHTGDIGQLDKHGYLYLRGRKSAMIVLSGGENVDPERVERYLASADEIREAGVLEREDRLVAVVVPEIGLLREVSGMDLENRIRKAIELALKSLPSHHRPVAFRIAMDPLPRTRLGKLRRHKLMELFDRLGKGETTAALTSEPISREHMSFEDQQLLSDPAAESTWNYLADRFHDLRLTPDSSLALDLGIDSLSWVELGLVLRDHAGINMDDSAIARVQTVRDLLREATASRHADRSGEDIVTALANPEQFLEPEQMGLMEPLGYFRKAIGLIVLGLVRIYGRLLLRVNISGKFPSDGPYLIVPRHLSALDPLVILQALNRKQLESLYWAGWTGMLFSSRFKRWFSRTVGILPIDPGAAPRSSLSLAVTCLKRGHSLIWFPEGRRSPDGRLQKLRPGIGLVLRVQPVPVIPVWIEGTRQVLPPGQWLPRFGRIHMNIGEPIGPDCFGREEREIIRVIHSELAALGSKVSVSG